MNSERETLSRYDIKAGSVVSVRLCSSDGREAVLEEEVQYASGFLLVGDGPVEVEYEKLVDYEVQCAYLRGENDIVMIVQLVREMRPVFSGVIVRIEKTGGPRQPIGRYLTALSNIELKIKRIYALVKKHLSFSGDLY
jgi:hypothetical protein